MNRTFFTLHLFKISQVNKKYLLSTSANVSFKSKYSVYNNRSYKNYSFTQIGKKINNKLKIRNTFLK